MRQYLPVLQAPLDLSVLLVLQVLRDRLVLKDPTDLSVPGDSPVRPGQRDLPDPLARLEPEVLPALPDLLVRWALQDLQDPLERLEWQGL